MKRLILGTLLCAAILGCDEENRNRSQQATIKKTETATETVYTVTLPHDSDPVSVPEPGTLILSALGLAAVGFFSRRH